MGTMLVENQLDALSGKIADAKSKETLNSVVNGLSSSFCLGDHFFGSISFGIDKSSTLAAHRVEQLSGSLCEKETEQYIHRQMLPLFNEHTRGVGKNIPKVWSTQNCRWENLSVIGDQFSKTSGRNAKPEAIVQFSQLNCTKFGILAMTKPRLKSELDVSAFHSISLRISKRWLLFRKRRSRLC